MSLPPRFIQNDGSFEDWAEGFWTGCIRPDEKTEAVARAAFDAGKRVAQPNFMTFTEWINKEDPTHAREWYADELARKAWEAARATASVCKHGKPLTMYDAGATSADCPECAKSLL